MRVDLSRTVLLCASALVLAHCERGPAARERQLIRVDPVNLGVVTEDRLPFRFDIPVDEETTVVSVNTSCPCLSVLEYSKAAPKGDALVVRGTLDTYGLSGAIMQRVQIVTSSQSLYIAEVRAEVHRRAFARPPVVDSKAAKSDGEFTGTSEIVVPDAESGASVSLTKNASGLEVMVSPVAGSLDGTLRAKVTMAGALQPGTDWAAYSLDFEVDRGDRTEHVPLRVAVARPPGVAVSPRMLVFEGGDEGDELSGSAFVTVPPGSSRADLEIWTEPRTTALVELNEETGELTLKAERRLLPFTVFVADRESWAELYVCLR